MKAFSGRIDQFIQQNTRLQPADPSTGLQLRIADQPFLIGLQGQSGKQSGTMPPVYWATAWPGGIAVARYLLENPDICAGRTVLDLGSGSGIVAIAAAKAGARAVIAVDPDIFACHAIRLNADANDVQVDIHPQDILDGDPPDCALMTIGDLLYKKELSARALRFADKAIAKGCDVLIGDPGRGSLPKMGVELLQTYAIAGSPEWDENPADTAHVWRYHGAQAGGTSDGS